MYRPAHFDIDDPTELHRLMADIGSAHLVTTGPGGLDSTLLPVLIDPDRGPLGSLVGHLARGNPQWREANGQSAMAILTGPQGYVSPGWYPSKAENHKVVPTWNYVVVHAHGELVVHDDAEVVGSIVRRLTDHNEADLEQPWSVDDAPPEFIESMVRGIVGIELRITRLEGKAKLSQNRPTSDAAGVVAGLEGRGPSDQVVAAAMRARGLG
ncbi:MAG: FMN-binding negative transcriptional regulator [Actinomycetia bacterium]|nr:FMN-binding negative transcriptional regulator [Actinomycetes bacterium]